MKYFLFERIVIGIAIIAMAITPIVYFLGNAILARMPNWGAEVYTAIVTVIVAVGALFFSIWQSMETRRHNKLSVRPLLRASRRLNVFADFEGVDFNFVNSGVGPAIIKKFVLLNDNDEIISCNDDDAYHGFLIKGLRPLILKPNDLEIGALNPNDIMQAGEKHIMWKFEYIRENGAVQFINKLNFWIEYQSIYEDETFIYDSKDDPLPINPDTPNTSALFSMAQRFAHLHASCFTIPRPWPAQEFVNLLQNPTVFYIVDEHGFAIGQRLDEEQVEILTLAIVPYEQGKGRGHDLLNNFIVEIKKQGGKSIFLEVAKNNIPALRLYNKIGFKKVGLRTAYYKVPDAPPVDAILMRLDIKTPLAKD